MSLEDKITPEKVLVEKTRALGFEKGERNNVCDVYRTAKEYALRHGASRLQAVAAGLRIADQYIREEIDKWHRRGYKYASERPSVHVAAEREYDDT